MTKHMGLTVTLLMSLSIVFGQKEITGKVIDAATHQGLQGVTVTDLQNNINRITDQNGNFSLPEKTDSIQVSSIGYYTTKAVVNKEKILISLSQSFANLNEVIVSGNREIQKRTEVPVAIDVISKTQINDTKATRIDQLVNKIPGVFMVDLGNEQHSMSVRQPLGYNNLFLYLEDGIPIRTVGDFNHNALIEINQGSLQRIEVIKGPASSLYGSEAVGGALNFITQSPSPFLTGKVQAEAGTRGYKRTDFNISNTYKKLGLYFGGYYADQNQPISQHNNFNKTALTFRADYAFNDKTKLVTVADYINYNTNQKGGLDSADFYNEDYNSLYRFTYRKADALRVRSTLSKKWNENNSTNFTVFYRNTSVGQNPFYSISDLAGNPSKAAGQINDDAFKSYGAVVQHIKKINSLHTKWTTGISVDYSPATYWAQFINIHKDSNGVYDRYQSTDSILTDYKVDLLNTAAYTQIEYNPVSKLRIVLAARYDRLDYNFDNHLQPGAYTGAPDAINHFDHFTPKAGLTYDLGNNKGFYVNYSVGFAPPNINDLYRGVQVPTLKPSSYINYEAGGWLAFDDNKGSGEISLYHLNGKNEIVNTRLADGSYQNQNAGETSHKGIELEIKYAPVKDITFRIGGTVAKHEYVDYIQQGKNFSGNEMAQSPSYIMNGEITFKPHILKGFRIGIETESLGSYFTDPQNTSKYNGFIVFNGRTGYSFKHFETWLNWINMTNKNYAVTVEKSAYGTSYRPGQLSTISIGLAYHFNQK
ncbi:MAG TPA: TonB-dependent receptor [Hanamia sp.]|nr:TonB-dependent receptor [Hanamia sp.]